MIEILKFATVEEANFVIRGGLVGGASANETFEGLVGLTITFSSPSFSHTFTQPTGTNPGQLRFSDVKSQLETASSSALVVGIFNKKIAFSMTGAAVALPQADEVARLVLGIANTHGAGDAISGMFLNPPDGAEPRYLEFVSEYGAIYVSISR